MCVCFNETLISLIFNRLPLLVVLSDWGFVSSIIGRLLIIQVGLVFLNRLYIYIIVAGGLMCFICETLLLGFLFIQSLLEV